MLASFVRLQPTAVCMYVCMYVCMLFAPLLLHVCSSCIMEGAGANDVEALKLRLGEETRADVVRANTLGVASSCDSPERCCNALFFDPKLYPFLTVAKSTQC